MHLSKHSIIGAALCVSLVGCSDSAESSEPLESCVINVWAEPSKPLSCRSDINDSIKGQKDCQRRGFAQLLASGESVDGELIYTPGKRLMRASLVFGGGAWRVNGRTLEHRPGFDSQGGFAKYTNARCTALGVEADGPPGPFWRFADDVREGVLLAIKFYPNDVPY